MNWAEEGIEIELYEAAQRKYRESAKTADNIEELYLDLIDAGFTHSEAEDLVRQEAGR